MSIWLVGLFLLIQLLCVARVCHRLVMREPYANAAFDQAIVLLFLLTAMIGAPYMLLKLVAHGTHEFWPIVPPIRGR
ncbi:MAG: hypothetical protein KDA92_16040 [Planctomycetales bacterium]|nr:hypothetical protein [Planctomycetales bacterium]MCA9166820.1 hypothetical protein [Planctomycetales bacterium]